MSGTNFKDVKARYRAGQHDIDGMIRLYDAGKVPFSRVEEVMGVTGLAAELVKKNEERKVLHQMLSDAGVPELSYGSGEGICLIGRVAAFIDRS